MLAGPIRRRSLAALMSTVAIGTLASTTALAQQTASTTAAAADVLLVDNSIAGAFTRLGRIVLGTGTPKVAIDTPQAVTVIDREDMDRTGANTLGEVFEGVPGVQATGASARVAGQAINIRGIGNADQTASESRIIVNVDGAPKFFEQYRMGSFFGDTELYKSVEVLRGPASSTLYGSGAIGGVVNFTTRDAADFIVPGMTGALRFKAAYDSNGDGTLGSIIYATRIGENADLLIAGNMSQGGDVVDGDGKTIPGTAFTQNSALIKGRLFLGDAGEHSFELSLSQTDTDLEDTLVAQTGGAASSGFGTADMDAIDKTAVLTYGYAPPDNPLIDLEFSLSYSDTTVKKDNFSLGALCAVGQTQVLCNNDAGYETTVVRLENTFDLSAGDWDNFLTVGLQAQRQERTASSSKGSLAFHPEGNDDRDAFYIQGEFIWNDQLTLIPGLRIENVDQEPGAGAKAAGAEDSDGNAVSPKLAALYQVNNNWGVFGSLARTERLPTLDELYSSEPGIYRGGMYTAARLPSMQLDKETATTVELGFTFQAESLISSGDTLMFKVTGFNNDIDDLIATTPRPTGRVPQTPVPYFSNINQAEIWGAEVEGSYAADAWFADVAYSNVRSEDKATGLTLVDTPAENISLTVGANLPNQNLVMGWTGAWFDSITTSSATTSAPSYNTQSLFVTWTPDEGPLAGLILNASVENIFDETYRNNLELDNAPGRTFKISLAKALDW